MEGGATFSGCEECIERIAHRTRYYCKYCGVPVKGENDVDPILPEKPHKLGCPRNKYYKESNE